MKTQLFSDLAKKGNPFWGLDHFLWGSHQKKKKEKRGPRTTEKKDPEFQPTYFSAGLPRVLISPQMVVSSWLDVFTGKMLRLLPVGQNPRKNEKICPAVMLLPLKPTRDNKKYSFQQMEVSFGA